MWSAPGDYRSRPVAVLGGGLLGRRIACSWAAAGYRTHIRDPSEKQREGALKYVKDNIALYNGSTGTQRGTAKAFESLEEAVKDAWIVFEAVPEKLDIKIDTFAELEDLTRSDCILASNSSSYKTSEILGSLREDTKQRILNTHYYMPPVCQVVELMTDGHTCADIFPFLVARHREASLLPFVVRKESTGFIFNRVWAAIKREVLTIMAEGVSTAEELDQICSHVIQTPTQPCRMMDYVGLDTVMLIEQHYIRERGLSSDKTVDFLTAKYIEYGKLGNKSSKGGLYPPASPQPEGPQIILCELGLSKNLTGKKTAKELVGNGCLLRFSVDGKPKGELLSGIGLPDGIVFSKKADRLYVTDMGMVGQNDGRVFSVRLDGSDMIDIVPRGSVHTPKQIALDEESDLLYFCDREGLRVMRCKLDGSDLEILVQNGSWSNANETEDANRWCVGICVAPSLGKFFWTQKGFSKSGGGRIFSADINMPSGQTASNRQDIRCVLDRLPEPIDLEFDARSSSLVWTDRGELPFGNTLNKTQLDASGAACLSGEVFTPKHKIIAQNFDETIGLKVDAERRSIFVTDLGGSLWRCDMDGGHKTRLFEDKSDSFAGLVVI